MRRIAERNGRLVRVYQPYTVSIRVCSTIGSMSDEGYARSGTNLLLLCLAALIFGAILIMGFHLSALR
jgi:hypothetical protein